MVKRLRRISPWSMVPSRIMTLGFPHNSLRKATFFRVITDRMLEIANSVRIGMRPVWRGNPRSCMGTEARSAMRKERTNSEGSSSPT